MSRFLLLMIAGLGALAAAVLFAQGERERGLAAGEDTWVAAAPMPAARANHHAVRLIDGRVLVVGGGAGTAPLPDPIVYDPASDSWSSVTTGWTTTWPVSATRLADGRVLVTTDDPGDSTIKARIFNPATNAWSAAGSTAYERTGFTATLRTDGTVVIIGGWDSGIGAPAYAVEKYTPSTNTWSIESVSPRAHTDHTATSLPNAMRIEPFGRDAGNTVVASELYLNGVWSPAGADKGRFGHTATLMWDGRVLVVGGTTVDEQFFQYPSDPLVYDPLTNTWSTAGIMTARHGHTATLLPSGLVLVVGGDQMPPTARVFIPSANDWAWVAEPLSIRHSHEAALLADGTVLVMGGYNSSMAVASAEIYTPPSAPPAPNTPTATGSPTATATPTPTNTPGGPLPTSTPTASPTSIIQDSDGDGCRDWQENGSNPQYGGLRDPFNPYDFYDINSTRKIDGIDIGLVRGRYNPGGPVPPEDEIYDRSPGTAEWAPGAPSAACALSPATAR